MARRHRRKIEMEEALSLGDALSIRIIVFLLLVIFLVPLISIGKARLVKAKKDDLWPKVAAWIQAHPSAHIKPYQTALELPDQAQVVITERGPETWLESYQSADSILLIARHNRSTGVVRVLRIERFGTVPILNESKLAWSPMEGEWFASGTPEYLAQDSMSQNLISAYKAAVLKERGL